MTELHLGPVLSDICSDRRGPRNFLTIFMFNFEQELVFPGLQSKIILNNIKKCIQQR